MSMTEQEQTHIIGQILTHLEGRPLHEACNLLFGVIVTIGKTNTTDCEVFVESLFEMIMRELPYAEAKKDIRN